LSRLLGRGEEEEEKEKEKEEAGDQFHIWTCDYRQKISIYKRLFIDESCGFNLFARIFVNTIGDYNKNT